MKPAPIPVADDLYLIPLTPPLAGFDRFIGAWLHLGRPSFLLDVGPASTAPALLATLNSLKVTRLDYILLTHIHLDHAGAVAEAAAAFDQPPIVCHRDAIPHLIEPSRLWEGSKKVLGRTAEGYGPIRAVPAERLIDAAELNDTAIVAVETPGHAVHHVSYVVGDFLFAGEAGGVWMDLADAGEYLRPATPPRFFLNTALASIERLMPYAPRWLCYGHFGMADGAGERLVRQREQLLFWERRIGQTGARVAAKEQLEDACLQVLLREDPLLSNFDGLKPDIRRREAYFLRNSIRGFLGWLRDGPHA